MPSGRSLSGGNFKLSAAKTRADLELAESKHQLDAVPARQRDNPASDTLRAAITLLTQQSTNAAVRIGMIDSVVSAIDTFLVAIRAVPQGAKRNALASADLHELLHAAAGSDDAGAEGFSHVLLVKAQAGQINQLLDNKPLFLADKFSVIADVTVTYMLIQSSNSRVATAGTVTGTVRGYGKIGEAPKIEPALIN